MLKGKTTIQLMDAKTGKVTDEVTKDNLVTNAVKNALGGAFGKVAMTDNYNFTMSKNGMKSFYNLPSGKNFAQTLFGGVLIFSQAIEENVEHIIPTIQEIKSFIGCANQSVGNTGNSFRGSLNADESVVGNNYVKFVWDFTTEQANGDIACICLTSDCGGAAGWGFNASDSTLINRSIRDFNDPEFWNSSKEHSINNVAHDPLITGGYSSSNADVGVYIDGDYFYYISRGTAYRYNISKALNNFGLDIIDGFNYGKLTAEQISTGISVTNKFNSLVDGCTYLKEGSTYSNLNLVKYSGNGVAAKVAIPTSNINTSIVQYLGQKGNQNTLNWQDCVAFKDKIYVIVGQVNFADLTARPNKMRVYILNFDGTFTYKDVSLTDKMVTLLFGTTRAGGYYDSGLSLKFSVFQGYLCCCGNNQAGLFLIDDDGTIADRAFMSSYNLPYYCKKLEKLPNWLPEPYMSCIFGGTHSNTLFTTELISAYLATINNQDVVLTKTADKTMKIIYTLTQV